MMKSVIASSLFILLLIMPAITSVSAASATISVDPVHWFINQVVGANVPDAFSKLVRTDNGVYMTLHTSGLKAGDAVTVWWVIFNHPENCTHGKFGLRCFLGDLSNAAAGPSVLFGAGHVIGGNGVGDYGSGLSVGDTTGALFGPGITNPRGADVHLIVHVHGPYVPGMPAMIHSFDSCNPTCVDVQASAHEA